MAGALKLLQPVCQRQLIAGALAASYLRRTKQLPDVDGGGVVDFVATISRDYGASRGDVRPLTLSLWIVDDWRR